MLQKDNNQNLMINHKYFGCVRLTTIILYGFDCLLFPVCNYLFISERASDQHVIFLTQRAMDIKKKVDNLHCTSVGPLANLLLDKGVAYGFDIPTPKPTINTNGAVRSLLHY